jgi:hypothetical protein
MDTWWDVVLDYWTVTIFLPSILLILFIIGLITRITDRD